MAADELITTGEALAFLEGYSRERLVRRIQIGEVRGRFIGGHWFAERASVIAFARRLRRDSAKRSPAAPSAKAG